MKSFIPRSLLLILRLLTVVVVLLCCNSVTAQINNSFVELIREQQLLSQRIASSYIKLYYDHKLVEYYQERDHDIQKFKDNLDELLNSSPNEKITLSIKNLKIEWERYEKVANWEISKKGAYQIIEECDYTLHACNQLLKNYNHYLSNHQDVSEKISYRIDIYFPLKELGKRHMLINRILFYFILINDGLKGQEYIDEYTRIKSLYNKIFFALDPFKYNSHEINDINQAIRKDWDYVQGILDASDVSNTTMRNLFVVCDRMGTQINKLKTLYQGLNTKLSLSKFINNANFEKMLVQRIAKAYVAISLQNKASSKFRGLISTDIKLFEDNLSILLSNSPNEDIRAAIKTLQLLWKNYKKLCLVWKTKSVFKVLEQSHVLMAACNNLIVDIQGYAKTIPQYQAFFNDEKGDDNIANLLLMVGEQRVLAQRIPTYIMMSIFNQDAHLSKNRLNTAITKYKENSSLILSSNLNTTDLKQTTQLDLDANTMQEITADDLVRLLELYEQKFKRWHKVSNQCEEKMDFYLLEKHQKDNFSRF